MRQGTQVALIEEAELDVAVRHEGANRPGLERGEPVHAGEALQRGDLRRRDHPPVAHHHERFHPKSLADPLDLGHQRRRIAGVALEHRDGHRAAPGIRQQPVVHLELALLAIAVVAEGGQGAGGALEVARGQIVEHEPPGPEVARGQLLLDAVLPREQPIHRFVEGVLVGVADAEVGGQRGGVPPPRRRQLAVGLEDPGGDHRHDEIALPRRARGDEGLEAHPLHRGAHGLHVAVVRGGHHLEQRVDGRERFASQQPAEEVDFRRRPPGEVRQGTVLDLPALPVALAQQDRGRRASVRHGGDVHVNISAAPAATMSR